jgi:hypothetical protein
MTPRITLNDTPEQNQLIKAMLSKDVAVASQAREAFAAVMQDVILEVIQHAGTASMFYQDFQYNEDENPSFQLDLFYNEAAGSISVWQQNMAGGLPVNTIEGVSELKFSTYNIYSAIELNNKYIKRSTLPIVSKALQRMSQEVLLKQEKNAYAVVLRALAEASTSVNGTATKHIITSTNQNQFDVQDINLLFTRMKRIAQSFANGTPDPNSSRGLTDLFLSYEMYEQVRQWPYNPVNNRGSQSTGPVGLPESVRESIFNAAGAASVWGVTLHELAELGVSKKYNELFGAFATGNIAHSSQAFDYTDDEIILGVDMTKEAFWRPVAKNADSGSTFTAEVSDEYVNRQKKIGFNGSMEEGRICIDGRAVSAIVV